jgi:hypothetical protein
MANYYNSNRGAHAAWYRDDKTEDASTDDEVGKATEAMKKLGKEATSGNESGDFVKPPPRPSRTKKRHMTNSGEKPPNKEAKGEGDFRDRSVSRYSSRYGADGRLIEPSKAQENASRMAAEDKADRNMADRNRESSGARRPRPRGSGLGGGDIGNGRGRGRGRGGQNYGNDNGRDYGNKNSLNAKLSSPNAGSAAKTPQNAGSAATKNRNGQMAAKTPANDPGLLGAGGSSAIHVNPEITLTGTTSKSHSILESKSTGEPANSPPSSAITFKMRNPSYAAVLAKQLAAAERILHVYATHSETLELSETQFDAIIVDIERQACLAAVHKEPAPKTKWSKYSQYGDKGFIGVENSQDAILVMAAVRRFEFQGQGYRAWCAEDLEPKNLVSINISLHQSKLGAPLIMLGLMAANTLGGLAKKAHIVSEGGWDWVTRSGYDTLKFFADGTLFQDLLDRRNGDEGRRLYLTVGTQQRQVFLSEQPGVAAQRARDRKEVADFKNQSAYTEANAKAIADALEAAEIVVAKAMEEKESKDDNTMDETDNANKGKVAWEDEVPTPPQQE